MIKAAKRRRLEASEAAESRVAESDFLGTIIPDGDPEDYGAFGDEVVDSNLTLTMQYERLLLSEGSSLGLIESVKSGGQLASFIVFFCSLVVIVYRREAVCDA